MSVVAVDALAVASLANGEGGLADQGGTIITVGVTPDAIKLQKVRIVKMRIFGSHTILSPQTTATTDRGSIPTD